MRTKRDDIKRKYNSIFKDFATDFNTEVEISDKPLIATFNGYNDEVFHNFHFQFKNGIKFYTIINDETKKITYLSVRVPNQNIKKKIPEYLMYINQKLNIPLMEGFVEDDVSNPIKLETVDAE
jgi:hypothetical protein